jgi:hypothetical protein
MGARKASPRGPVLLLGAGTGEATCGILYLASYLRRHGVEAVVRLTDHDETEAELRRSLAALLTHVRPRMVGVSLKWFHHVARGLRLARVLKALDPEVQVVFGGNSASAWWKELLAQGPVDHVVLGDGEVPLLALARGDAAPPNVVSRGRHGALRPALQYQQGAKTDDVYYSHFDELFLSREDAYSFSGWVAPGKGCGENCLYCAGTRGMQKATFGRAKPFLRPVEAVQRDHREIVPGTWQLRYDFAGSSAEFLSLAWEGLDLSRHSVTYFLWGVPPPELVDLLAARLGRVFMIIDIGCFSEAQRQETMRRGLLKPCPTDQELLRVIELARRHPNLELEISGIAGLPFANRLSLAQERRLVEQLVSMDCTIGYQRLEAQPGALVTEHPGRFGMVSEAQTFEEFVEFFEAQAPGDKSVPMVRYADEGFEAELEETAAHIDELVWAHAERKQHVAVPKGARLVNAAASTEQLTVGEWLGAWSVPARVAKAPVTVVRANNGHGLALAPTLATKTFSHGSLTQGADAVALGLALETFARPTTVERGVAALRSAAMLPAAEARGLVDALTQGRFLVPA